MRLGEFGPSGLRVRNFMASDHIVATIEAKGYCVDRAGGYLMIKEFRAENFRKFRKFCLPGLRRINIIVGRNACGKTALLEGLRIATLGSPAAVPELNWTRGGYAFPSLTAEMFRSMWETWFLDRNMGKTILLYYDSDGVGYTLRISFDFEGAVTAPNSNVVGIPPSSVSPPTEGPGPSLFLFSPTTMVPIAFERLAPAGKTGVIRAMLTAQGLVTYDRVLPEWGPATHYFPSTSITAPSDNAQRFSNLVLAGRREEIVAVVRREFPFIKDVSVLSPTGIPLIWATLDSGVSLPMTIVSAGLHKFLSLILAVVALRRGVLLIDEIENGLFHDRLEALWSVLHHLSCESEAQIFATTHSLECLRATYAVVSKDPDSFALIKMEERNGQIEPRVLPGTNLEAAIEQDVDARD